MKSALGYFDKLKYCCIADQIERLSKECKSNMKNLPFFLTTSLPGLPKTLTAIQIKAQFGSANFILNTPDALTSQPGPRVKDCLKDDSELWVQDLVFSDKGWENVMITTHSDKGMSKS